MLDPLTIAQPIESVGGRQSFVVEPSMLYSAMVAHIRAGLTAGPFGLFANEDVRTGYVAQAMALPEEAWDLVLQPATEAMPPADRQLRAEALRIARKWFQERLHQAIGGNGTPLFLRITKDPAYRS